MKLSDVLPSKLSQEDLTKVFQVISETLDDSLVEKDSLKLYKKLYSLFNPGHYNQVFANKQISQMYYEDNTGKVYGPYKTEEEVKEIYDKVKYKITSNYNFFDFEVAFNMIWSDYHNLLINWFEDVDITERVTELTLNWLDDEDNPYGDQKVWGYFNSTCTYGE